MLLAQVEIAIKTLKNVMGSSIEKVERGGVREFAQAQSLAVAWSAHHSLSGPQRSALARGGKCDQPSNHTAAPALHRLNPPLQALH